MDAPLPVVRTTPPGTSRDAASLAHLDLLRCIACAAVILLHVTLGLVHYRSLTSAEETFCLALNSLTWWAVPAFVMISGALLLEPARQRSVADFYRRRLARIGWPMLFWCALYMAWPLVFPKAAVNRYPDMMEARGWHGLWLGEPYYHLHFLFLIGGLYAIAPLLTWAIRAWGRRFAWGAMLAGFALASTGTWLLAWADCPPNLLTRFVPFVPYFLAGYCLKNVVVARRGMWAVAVGLGGMALFEYYWLASARQHWTWISHEKAIANYLSPPVIGMALAVFILARAFWAGRKEGARANQHVQRLASAGFGIYLIHPLVLDVLARMTRDGARFGWPKPMEIALGVGCTLVLSYLLTRVLQRWSLSRRLVG